MIERALQLRKTEKVRFLTELDTQDYADHSEEYERLLSHWTKDRLNINITYAPTYKSFGAVSNPAGDANNIGGL